MTAEIEIRPASPADAPLLAAMHAVSFGENAWNAEQIKGSLVLETTQGWIAGKDGFILCQTGPEGSEILTFCVHPESRKRGIGEVLLQQALKAAIESGSSTFFLEVAVDNHAARTLYRKLGFRETASRKGYYRRGNAAVDAVFYEKTLAAQHLHKSL